MCCNFNSTYKPKYHGNTYRGFTVPAGPPPMAILEGKPWKIGPTKATQGTPYLRTESLIRIKEPPLTLQYTIYSTCALFIPPAVYKLYFPKVIPNNFPDYTGHANKQLEFLQFNVLSNMNTVWLNKICICLYCQKMVKNNWPDCTGHANKQMEFLQFNVLSNMNTVWFNKICICLY